MPIQENRLGVDTTSGYVNVFGKWVRKKYTWRCELCGHEYIFRWQAKDCEHRAKFHTEQQSPFGR